MIVRRALWLVALAACVAVVVIVGHVLTVERDLRHASVLGDASDLLRAADAFRGIDLSARAPEKEAALYKVSPHVFDGAPLVQGTYEFALASKLAGADGGSLHLYSPYPFPSNPKGGLLDDFMTEAWKTLREKPEEPFFRYVTTENGDKVLRYAIAEVMADDCVACHNASPWSPKRDWRSGEIAGVFEVEVPRGAIFSIARSAAVRTFTVFFAMSVVCVAAIWLLIKRLKRSANEAQRFAAETDELNRALGHEVAQRRRAEIALSSANERLSTNHAQLERWAADLEIAHTRLRDVDELKTKFLSEVSHELRSPVAAIVSAAKIITKHHNSKPEVVDRFGKTIVSEGERMTRLINDFLDLTKIEAGCIDWNEGEVDVETLVNGVIANCEALAVDGGISLINAVEPPLPKLHGDSDRLTQVLTNLVNNAIKYTPSNGSITLRALRQGDDLLFAVDDTGPGIPADEVPNVFDRFKQVRAERYDGKKRGGTGLGLCISREIVQHYGGRIWVESEVGHGSSFCFTVPLQRDAGAQLDRTADNGAAAARTARVVVMLEDVAKAERAANAGSEGGLDCRACASTEELVSLQEKWSPDVYVVSEGLLESEDETLVRIRSDALSKLLVYSTEHGLTAPSLLDSAELLVPSLRAHVSHGAKVLIVDDDDKYRGLLEFELQQAGYTVVSAPNGREALTALPKQRPDAMILDLIMPGMDGLAVLEHLAKAGGVDIPVLVYTAMDEASVALAARNLGATEVFRKDGGTRVAFTAVTARVRRVLADALAATKPASAAMRTRSNA